MPKIFPYQSRMSPPVQVGVIPNPNNTNLDVESSQTRLRKSHAQVGFDMASPVLPQPNPQVIAPTLNMPELPIRLNVRQQDTGTNYVPVIGIVPPSPVTQFVGPQFPRPKQQSQDTTAGIPPVDAIPLSSFVSNELPTKKRPIVGESCHNPSPQAIPLTPRQADLGGVPPRKLRQPDAGPLSPPWSTTNWVREDAWGSTLSFLPSRPVRTVQPESYSAPKPIPNPDLINAPWDFVDAPQTRLRANRPAESFAPLTTVLPTPGVGYFDVAQTARPKREAQTPSAGIITALLPTYANAWGAAVEQPLRVRRQQQADSVSPLFAPGLLLGAYAMPDVALRRATLRYIPDLMPTPSVAASIPFPAMLAWDIGRKRVVRLDESVMQPLYFFSPTPLNLAAGLDVCVPLAKFAPWRFDWTVAPPWAVFIGFVPDPTGCFDPILLGKTVTRHATYQLGTVTQLPGKVRLAGKPYDLSNALVSIAFVRPDGTTFTQPVTVYNAPGGLIYYQTQASDFNMVGVWSRQWVITDANNLPPYPAIQFTVAPSNPAPTFFGPASVFDDWRYIDNLEPLRITNPDGTSVCSDYCLRRPGEDVRVTDGDFEYDSVTTRFHVWKAHLGDFKPQNRAKCTDQFGVDWFVEKIDSQTFDTRFVLTVRLQAGKGI